MNGEDGSLPPAGRFQRIEESLARIEDKLDTKAEAARVEALTERVTSLESTRQADALLKASSHTDEKDRRSEKKANIAIAAACASWVGSVTALIVLAFKVSGKG